jgi:hypothetical protein
MGALGAPITAQSVTRLTFLPSIRDAPHAQLSQLSAFPAIVREGSVSHEEA